MASDLRRAVKEALAGRIFISSSVVPGSGTGQDEEAPLSAR